MPKTIPHEQQIDVHFRHRWEDYFPESVNAKGNGGFANIDRDGAIRVGGFRPVRTKNGNVRNYLGAFGPRIGIAYQLKPKTVVRIGYGAASISAYSDRTSAML